MELAKFGQRAHHRAPTGSNQQQCFRGRRPCRPGARCPASPRGDSLRLHPTVIFFVRIVRTVVDVLVRHFEGMKSIQIPLVLVSPHSVVPIGVFQRIF